MGDGAVARGAGRLMEPPSRFDDLRRLMIVDDDAALLRSLSTALSSDNLELRCCASTREARAMLDGWAPEVIVLDVVLDDGDAYDVLAHLQSLDTAPAVVAISGAATAPQAFRLAQLGVGGFLTKPFSISELRHEVDGVLSAPPRLEERLRQSVGRVPLRDVENRVRTTMVREAMAQAGGGRKGAARLLRISRQMLQHILRKADD